MMLAVYFAIAALAAYFFHDEDVQDFQDYVGVGILALFWPVVVIVAIVAALTILVRRWTE